MTSDFLHKKTEQNLPLYNKENLYKNIHFFLSFLLSSTRSFSLSLYTVLFFYGLSSGCPLPVRPWTTYFLRFPLSYLRYFTIPITNHSASSRSLHLQLIIIIISVAIIIITAPPLTWPYWWRSQRAPPWRPRLRCRTGPSLPSSSCGSIYSAPRPRSHCCCRPPPAWSSWARCWPHPGPWRTGWHCWSHRCCQTRNSKRHTWA